MQRSKFSSNLTQSEKRDCTLALFRDTITAQLSVQRCPVRYRTYNKQDRTNRAMHRCRHVREADAAFNFTSMPLRYGQRARK